MPTQRLVIDGDARNPFCIALRDGAVTVGADPARPGVLLGPLRVVRIRCEIDVEEDAVAAIADPDAPDAATRAREIRWGEELHAGGAHIRLTAAPEPPAPPAPAAVPEKLGRRLLVIDGADAGRVFPLPASGVVTVGNSQKHAGVVLHDLYVARVHCELEVTGDRVVVTHHQGRSATRVNDKEIATPGTPSRRCAARRQFAPPLRHRRHRCERRPRPGRRGIDHRRRRGGAGRGAGGGRARKPPPDPLLQLEGQVLGNYHFGAVLGRGLSSLVFQARHRQTNQVAVVKVLAREFPQNDAELQTFIRALRVAAPLRHPHLVTLQAAGKTGSHCWIARDYVAGEGLAAVIARLQTEGKLGWKRACRVAVHLGQALDHLHNNRIVLTRITPANVLIENDTRAARLADVMLVQALRGSRLEEVLHDKRQLAELPYSAPETVEPGATADHRAGLYSLGAVLYALLTGQPPFDGDTLEEIIARVREGKVMKPSKTLRELPPQFEAAVLRLLARRPEDRFQTAAEFLGSGGADRPYSRDQVVGCGSLPVR